MKLVHQINLAFSVVLLLVLSVTLVVTHYVLLDHFIEVQKKDLKTIGVAMKAELVREGATEISTTDSFNSLTGVVSSSSVNVDAILTDEEGKILSTSVPLNQFGIFANDSTNESFNLESIWNGTDKRFISEVNATPQGTLTLLAPMSKVKQIEQALFQRMLIVFCLAGVLMFLFSLFITKKLIHPLIKLQGELKKVKERNFSDVQLIKAGGEIGSVAQSVYDMAGELKQFNHVQKQFFQNASHELKTPLMSISGYAEGIRDGVFKGDSVRRGLDIIMGESSRLKNIVTEMTLLAKLDSEEDIITLEKFSLKELLIETIERMNPLLMKRELLLHTTFDENELMITADKDKLLQALINVFSNATRYANSQIYLNSEIRDGRVEVIISDDGPGIPEELLPYLFHRFVKGKDGDSGLGLAISRAIVERCGGMITASNSKEVGAVISIVFSAAVK
ncbi:HAMP domain-containing sensor histidine kinase [Lysinibacillus fusiformis]|uniref:HAMP domain-containing sensor histidine kinase n=1 Tax=Lysinibacillus fusiformis TaxID=28031 RepID=UPI0011A16CF9|nr:HAMP domain-containing sensor histidine kinase [Lysinibacillus fusiformis]